MRVKDIYNIIDHYAPFDIAMSHDNAGFLVGNFDAQVTKVLVTLDADQDAMEHAVSEGCQLIVSHHPFIFEGENRVTDCTPQGRKILFALKNRLNIICAHTNLDSCEGGINDILGKLLALQITGRFCPTQNGGMLGRIGTHNFESIEQFLNHARDILNTTPRYRFVTERFEKVAWVSGSGSSCMEEALSVGADTLITGDCKYSAFICAAEMGLNLIDLGHFETEQIIVPVVANYLRENGLQVIEHIVSSPIKTFGE